MQKPNTWARRIPEIVASVLILLSGLTFAQEEANEWSIVNSSTFMNGHPDVRLRMEGFKSYDEKDYAKAYEFFTEAALYADKPAMAKMASMTWDGEGTEADHARSYALMKIASERGYPKFMRQTEIYRSELTQEEKDKAQAMMPILYQKFGDPSTKPRMNAKLAQGRGELTGSRLGTTSSDVQIIVPTKEGFAIHMDSSQFYNARYWNPNQYWAWVDEGWAKERTGDVELGDFKPIEDDTLPATNSATAKPKKK